MAQGLRMAISPGGVAPPSLLVVCLCAEWCHVCGDYKSRFEQVQKNVQSLHPQVQFLWIDVEDDADLLHPLEVENFPTLLIAAGDAPHVFGPMTPQVQTLGRMVQKVLQDSPAAALKDAALLTLVARIRQEKNCASSATSASD